MPDGRRSSMSGALEGDEERPAVQVYEELLQLLSAPPTRFRVKHTVIHPTDRYGNTAAKGGKGYAPKPIPWENHRFSGFPPFDAKTALSPRVPVWEVIERQQRVSNNLDELRTKREEIQQAVKNAQHRSERWSALRREKEFKASFYGRTMRPAWGVYDYRPTSPRRAGTATF